MVDFKTVLTNTDGANFPDTLTVNATGAGVGDGTELVKILMDQFVGAHYALMDAAGVTPDSLTEAPDTSQILESVRRISGSPGTGGHWWKNADPSVTGDRCLLLNGQVIAIATYTELVDATYVGDGNNGTASAFYKTSDAGGTTRDTAGAYFVLPDTRGYTLRGLDVAASVDPDGASRDLGSSQLDSFQGHKHQIDVGVGAQDSEAITKDNGVANGNELRGDGSSAAGFTISVEGPRTDGVNGTPRTATETRMVNIATKFYIRY